MRTSDELQTLQASLDGIGHVLRDLRLTVPVYQRSYSWETEEVQAFWDDLRAAVLVNDSSYFMGTIVLAGSSRSRDRTIIDGQQRLATASILLAAIRDRFDEAQDSSRATVIQNDYLTQQTLESTGRRARLQLNTQDAGFFNSLVLRIPNGPDNDPPFASNERIDQAYQLLKKNLDGEVEAARDSWASQLLRWVDFIEGGVQVIVVRVANDTDAFLVFETLNDRGLALTVADLLKNYLFGLASEDVTSVEGPWLAAVSTLESPEGSQRFLDFLRQYWSSWYGATRERDLYQSLRRYVRSDVQAIEVVERFQRGARNYLALITRDLDHWPSSAIDAATVESLHRLRLSQNRPLLLAAIEHLDEAIWVRLVQHVTCWAVRGLVVGGIGGGVTERTYSDAAVHIRRGTAQSVGDILQLLSAVVPSDEAFRLAMTGAAVPRNYLARYYWMAFERLRGGSEDSALIPVKDESEVALFRILPRSPSAEDWPAFEVNEIGAHANRLGNAVIIERELLNRSAAQDWNAIREAARGSAFESTRIVADQAEWSPQAIGERQALLAEVAPEIWPRLSD